CSCRPPPQRHSSPTCRTIATTNCAYFLNQTHAQHHLSKQFQMTQIDNALIDHLANLTRLVFDDEEKLIIQQDLEKVVGFFEKISELDTSNVEPLVYVNEDEYNVWREDVPQNLTTQTEALRNAPLKDEHYFLVPKVIQK
ncbi:MAG TPA: Asp-tRNA(Asn)/Glu-tRNA(Gln) amidotransferase subunit GatC, partial [Chitinophagales bacterium]|nr:Asp-tRNA(Asn)/Glu-tRNA(Gln) amidotransferase subunit GatC [Chitinophagales bacterium]